MGGITDNEETNIFNTPISERKEGEGTVPLFQIISLEVGRRGICGGSVEDVARFCISSVEEYNTASHTQ